MTGKFQKRVITDEQKATEAAFLKSKWLDYKSTRPKARQGHLAEKLGISQGLLHQWLVGKTAIAEWAVIELAIALEFDPRELRPSLDAWVTRVAEAIDVNSPESLLLKLQSLPETSRRIVEAVIDEQAKKNTMR